MPPKYFTFWEVFFAASSRRAALLTFAWLAAIVVPMKTAMRLGAICISGIIS
jgi:hypothetical protein